MMEAQKAFEMIEAELRERIGLERDLMDGGLLDKRYDVVHTHSLKANTLSNFLDWLKWKEGIVREDWRDEERLKNEAIILQKVS